MRVRKGAKISWALWKTEKKSEMSPNLKLLMVKMGKQRSKHWVLMESSKCRINEWINIVGTQRRKRIILLVEVNSRMGYEDDLDITRWKGKAFLAGLTAETTTKKNYERFVLSLSMSFRKIIYLKRVHQH